MAGAVCGAGGGDSTSDAFATALGYLPRSLPDDRQHTGDVMGLDIRHRLSAFADAVGQIDDRTAFVTGELRCAPLRPLVAHAARRRGSNPAAEWERLGSRMGYLRHHRLAGGGHIWIRHGTVDVFTVAEVLARDEYAIPE